MTHTTSHAHPPDAAFAAELGRLHGVLGAAVVTEVALGAAVQVVVPDDVLPEWGRRSSEDTDTVCVCVSHTHTHTSQRYNQLNEQTQWGSV